MPSYQVQTTGGTYQIDTEDPAESAPRNADNPNMLGPSPTLARVGNEVLGNLGTALKSLPSGIMAFIRHPIETTKTAVGQMDLENPEKSSGLLGLPDVLYRKLQSGDQTPEVIGDIATAALPGATAERAGLAGEALSGAAKSLASKALNAVPSTAVADVTGLASPRLANAIRVANRVKRGVQAFQNAGEEAPTATEAVSPEIQAMRDDIARGFKYKDFAHVTDSGAQETIKDLANRLNSGAAPEAQSASPQRPGPILIPRKFPPKTMKDIAEQELGTQGNPPSGQDIIRGSSNIPLSEQGAAEAQRLAQATAGQFDKIYTSPLDRAQATARAVASTNPQAGAPEPTEALTPWYLGAHEGQPTTTVLDKMQDLIQNKPDEVPAGRGPQSTKPGQSFNDFKDEFLSHVQNQVENYEPGQKILNATHYRDTRVLEAWAKAGAPDDFSVDVPTMLEKGDVKPGDLLHLNPQTMEVKAVSDASEPGIYFARHGATAWNAENGTVNPAESVGAPGPAGGPVPQPPAAEVARLNMGVQQPDIIELHRGIGPGSTGKNYYSTDREFAREFTRSGQDKEIQSIKVPANAILDLGDSTPFAGDVSAIDAAKAKATASGKSGFFVSEGENQPRSVYFVKQPPPAEAARLNAGAPPQPAPQGGGGMFLRNFDLDTMARALRSGLNKGSITKSQVSQVLNGQAQLELLRDQLGLKGRIPPNAAAYLRNKVF